jgi:DNA polymerase-3 subunit gamma/tau
MKKFFEITDQDFHEFNAANTRGIDTIREIRTTLDFKPWMGKMKIYLLDEAHKVTNDGQNALLKMLEDTPEHVIFILCTTEPEKLLKTIRTRCTTFQVKPLQKHLMMRLLRQVLIKEGYEVIGYGPILDEIIRVSEGLPRKALVLLDQVIGLDLEEAKVAIEKSIISETKVIDLCRKLLEKGPNLWDRVAATIKGLDDEPESIRYAILGYLGTTLLNTGDAKVAHMISIFSESFMYTGRAGLIATCFLACKS